MFSGAIDTGTQTLRPCQFHMQGGFDMHCGWCSVTNGFAYATFHAPVPKPMRAANDPNLTLVQAMRAAALGMQTVGLDPFGHISHQLTAGASALDALREAVKGCGKPFFDDVDCGEFAVDDPEPLLCHGCKTKVWNAITTLTSGVSPDGTR
jgi:hypothetical protein